MTSPPSLSDAQPTDSGTEPARKKRAWALALGTVAVWYLEPTLAEMAELVGGIACATNKSEIKDAIAQMRSKAASLHGQIDPLPASALAKVVRRTEAASGAVLDKGARIQEVQSSWEHFLNCLHSSPKR
ncbi:hypothetical protein [Polaromonas sp. A23]|uniref:hypothetical protein n=1 Tax=Polaromonas sp. A23 TaxID=1944133 RepID=UPI00111592CC|nr:hypothetical protein [Polaromonas sp. A23]